MNCWPIDAPFLFRPCLWSVVVSHLFFLQSLNFQLRQPFFCVFTIISLEVKGTSAFSFRHMKRMILRIHPWFLPRWLCVGEVTYKNLFWQTFYIHGYMVNAGFQETMKCNRQHPDTASFLWDTSGRRNRVKRTTEHWELFRVNWWWNFWGRWRDAKGFAARHRRI